MRFYVTGKSGFIGRRLQYALAAKGHFLADLPRAEGMIHLAWKGLPNYESEEQFENVEISYQMIRAAVDAGITNITVAGSCWEAGENLPPYVLAKKMLLEKLQAIPGIQLKWARLFYIYHLPNLRGVLEALRSAICSGAKTFSVVDGIREFMSLDSAAGNLVNIATQTKITGVIDCSTGVGTSVLDFCKRFSGDNILFDLEYPPRPYEAHSIVGDPTLMNKINELH